MADLSTSYLGLGLKNPVIVSSSNLTSTVPKVAACEAAGAGAVVLKSLFEEQIDADVSGMMENMDSSAYSEAFDFFQGSGQNFYLDKYLELVEESKKAVSIPVIASLNCVSAGNWIEYAKRIENVGADALELNVFIMPADVKREGREIERVYIDIVRKIRNRIGIPFALKIGPHFSGLANMIRELVREGASGIVLFNRFYRPDVDIERLRIKAAPILSAPEEMALSLQWIALLSGEIGADFGATTGIHNGESVIKQLLVGAKTVQLCSGLMKEGLGLISEIMSFITDWMDRHGYGRIDDFRGTLCQEESENPETYERSQYVKALVGIS